MDTRAKELIKQGDNLFDKRITLLSFWQEVADNFYPERADFTTTRIIGEEFADAITTSYPLIARRDLGNTLSSMLRPASESWFSLAVDDEELMENTTVRATLEAMQKLQRRAMYDRRAQFVRATKEGDHDFAIFGQCVILPQLSRNADSLLYQSFHLRDVAWAEGYNGTVDTVHRKWKPEYKTLQQLFGDKVHRKIAEKAEKNPHDTCEIRHCVVPSDYYAGAKKFKSPYVSIYYDVENCHIMEEMPAYNEMYVIPRWQTVSGSQYAYSPAAVAALPDARLIQAMTLSLLEAGEKATNPPMIAVQEAIRSDVSLRAGGVTWVDAMYDERLGEVLRPLSQNFTGIPIGLDMTQDIRQMIHEAFFLNKIALPPTAGMTAFETGQRIQEYIRAAMPLFEPMEQEYNGALCDKTFQLLNRAGAFRHIFQGMPQELSGKNIDFKFTSPLQESADRKKGQTFLESKALLADAATLDPDSVQMIDIRKALRDALHGVGTPAKWLRDEQQMAALDEAKAEQQQQQQLLQTLSSGAEVAGKLTDAGKTLAETQAIQ